MRTVKRDLEARGYALYQMLEGRFYQTTADSAQIEHVGEYFGIPDRVTLPSDLFMQGGAPPDVVAATIKRLVADEKWHKIHAAGLLKTIGHQYPGRLDVSALLQLLAQDQDEQVSSAAESPKG